MNKTRITLLCGALSALCWPALAVAESPNALALTIDALTDTENPAGDRAEKYGPGFSFEFSHAVWPRLELYAAAGGHRLRIEDTGSKTDLTFFDVSLGARQLFRPLSLAAWSPYLDLALAGAWLRDPDSTLGGNRRYDGWKAAFGVAKLLSDETELRFAVAYQRLVADDTRNEHTDVLSAAGFRLAVASRF